MSIMSPIAPAPIRRLTVAQGDSIASGDPTVVFTTVLGSCVAVCPDVPRRPSAASR